MPVKVYLHVTNALTNMDVNHVEDVSRKKQQVQSIFTLFGNLFTEKGRNGKEFVSLVNCISENDFSVGSGSNLQYSIKRFVRALTSAHLYPQCASFAALASLLKFELASAEQVLDILDAELKGNFTKNEQGGLKSGCVLTCGAIIQSGVYGVLSKETKEKVVQMLISSGKTKSYLLSVTYKFLADIVSAVDDKDFKNVIWPICKEDIKSSYETSSIYNYDLLLVCHQRFPKVVEKFILKMEDSYDSFIEKIIMLLLSSHVRHDEPIYERVCQALVANKKLLLKVWMDVINNASDSKSSFKDKTVITLFYNIMKNLNDDNIVPKLLVPKFIEAIIMILSFRKTKKWDDSDCNALAKSSIDLLVNYLIRENVSDAVRFKAIEKLMFYPANMKFEKKTGTKCIQSLILHLNDTSLKQLADLHLKIVSGDLKKTVDEEGNSEDWNSNEKQYVLHIFVKFLHHPSVKNEKEWKLEQIKFLFDTAFIKNSKIHPSVQKCARDCFYKAIEIQMASIEDILELLDGLVAHVNDKIVKKAVALSENATQSWNKVFTTINNLQKSDDKIFIAIHLLLIHMGFQLFSDTNLAVLNIDELLTCYSRLQSMHKKKNQKGEDDLHWSEVTVDLMLSLLSRENKLWRYVVCNLVFPQMVKHLTSSALHQIIDVINPQSSDKILNDDHSDSEDEEEEEEGEEEGEEDEEEEEKEDEKSESSLTESENDENTTLNDQLRSAVKDALGMSAALTDQESVDMDDMDEEEQRKLNERLAAAFKMFKSNAGRQTKKQTKEEKALTHFRFRVLDLVEIYVTNGPSITGCLDLLFPLFNLLELAIKDPKQRVFYHRVDSILKKLSSLKKFPDLESVNEKIISDHFEVLLSRKEVPSMIFVEMSHRISDCCTFLVRCSQMIPSTSSEISLVSNYNSLLDNFFHSRDNKLPITLFQSVLRSVWQGNWKLVSTLFDLVLDPSIKLFKKMKVIELLDIFYKNSKLHASGDDKKYSQLNSVENKFIKKFVEHLSEYQSKKVKMNEKMFLAFFTKILSLVSIASQSFNRHRSKSKKGPQWKDLIAKISEVDTVMTNKKSKKQVTNLANKFDVKLREPPANGTGPEIEDDSTDEEAEQETEEPAKIRKKKTLSAEKVKLRKESFRLREAASNDGISLVPFSSVDVYSLPEEVNDSDGDLQKAKKRKSKVEDMNGTVPSKKVHH